MTKTKNKDLSPISTKYLKFYSLLLIAVLYLPSALAFSKSRISADEAAPSFPSYAIKLKFVTPHFAPVQKCSIKITIDSEVSEISHDANGVAILNGQFKRAVTEDAVPIQIEISSGSGENQLTNNITKDLVKNASQNSLYELNDQIIYHPNLPKQAHLKGQVQDEQGQGIAKAKLSISIDYPVFQDFLTVYTDENGAFDVIMYLEQLNPIYGNLSIEADGYLPWNIKKDTEYTQGFYIVDHLYFEFDNPIVLKKGNVGLQLDITVVEHKINKPYSGSTVNILCKSSQDPNHQKTYTLGPTGDDGKVNFFDSQEFPQEDQIVCDVTANPKDNSLYPSTKSVTFLRTNSFKVDPLTVYVTTKPIIGQLKGVFLSDVDDSPIPNLPVSFSQISEIQALCDTVNTNDKGEFVIQITGFKSEGKYDGNIIYTSDVYDNDFKYPLSLTEDQSFSADAGILKATLKPVPVTINVAGTLLEKTLNTPLANYDLTITIKYKKAQKVDTIPAKSDGEGKFSYSFEGKNTESYVITLNTQSTEEYQELSVGNVRELGANKPLKFDADFKEVYISRLQTFGLIIGYLFDLDTNKPLLEGRITVVTDKPLPQQDIKCQLKESGNFRCDFVVEKYLTYDASIQVNTDYGMAAKTRAGELNKQNSYTITGLKAGVKFEIVPQKGLIFGTVFNGETNELITSGTYSILSIDPPIEDQDSVVNKEQNIDQDGNFRIELNLHLGPNYAIKVKFTSGKLLPSEQIFQLNYQNKYTLADLKITLGMQLNGLFSGQIVNKLYIPIPNAVVKVYVENVSNPFSGLSDDKGYFTVKVPAASTSEIVNAKFTVEKIRYQMYSDEIQLKKENKYKQENYEIKMSGEWWKSEFSGRIIDENNLPVPFCSISLEIKDSFKEPTTPLPYTTVSILNGDYLFSIDVNYDDTYMSFLRIKCNNFIDRTEPIELNYQNDYNIKGRVSKMERKIVTLVFSGIVLNSINEPVPGISIDLTFDLESKKHGEVRDLREGYNFNGYFEFKLKAYMGYIYRAKAEIKLPKSAIDADYQTYNFDLQFDDDNNYRVRKEIEIKKKLVDCLISGEILDADSKSPLINAQAILHFTQTDFSEYTMFVYTNDQGKFEIKTQIQDGYFYVAKAEGKYNNYKDNSIDIVLTEENKFTITDIQILLTKAGDEDFTTGFIHGHSLSITGEPLANSNVVAYSEVDPSVKYTVQSDVNGLFLLPDLKLVKGNVYAFIVELQPSDANFNKKLRKVHLSKNDDYQYNNLTLAAERVRVSYYIKGKVSDLQSGLTLGGTYLTVSFISQYFIDNSYTYTNQDGEFTLTGSVSKGLNYEGKIVFIHAGYETITPQLTLTFNPNAENADSFYVKSDTNFSLTINPFQKLYYVDEKNIIPIRSRVYEITTCKLFPYKYLPFVKVSLFFEKNPKEEGILIAETYTDLKGSFEIESPRPLFTDLQSYLVFERDGYGQLKEYQRISPNELYIEQGPHQINNKKGVSDCSKKQRKIQNRYDNKL